MDGDVMCVGGVGGEWRLQALVSAASQAWQGDRGD